MSTPGAQEFSGKSVDEAIAEGLRKLGLRSDQVTIDVINKGSRGLFGLGSEPAVVRIAPRGAAPAGGSSASATPPAVTTPHNTPATPPVAAAPVYVAPVDTPAPDAGPMGATAGTDALERAVDMVAEGSPAAAPEVPASPVTDAVPAPSAATARPAAESDERAISDSEISDLSAEMLTNVVRLMGFDANVAADWHDADDITEERHLLLSVHGRDVSALIGRRGETLENLQYLLRLMVNQRMHRWLNIIVDVEHYRSKRVEHLTHLAQRMADQVAGTGRAFALEPMPPNERRIVHLALRDDTRIFTESTGEGERRKVNIFPRK